MKNLDEDYVKKLVIARLRTMPPNMKLSIGDYGSFDKRELISQVDRGTPVGKETINSQITLILEAPNVARRLEEE